MIELKTGYKVVWKDGDIGLVMNGFAGSYGTRRDVIVFGDNWAKVGEVKEGKITTVYKSSAYNILLDGKLAIHENDELIWELKKETMIDVDGKEYSTETIKKALQEYVK